MKRSRTEARRVRGAPPAGAEPGAERGAGHPSGGAGGGGGHERTPAVYSLSPHVTGPPCGYIPSPLT
eukprot:8822434-Pyramimonas_sp.AAC.2